MKWQMVIAGIALFTGTVMAQAGGAGDYGILQRVSIFDQQRGLPQQVPPPNGNGFGSGLHADPAVPILVGVMEDDSGYTAFLSVTAAPGAASLVKVREGDTISWDKSVVREITWEGISVSGGSGPPSLIVVGNDLLDRSVQGIPAPPGVLIPLGRNGGGPGGLSGLRGMPAAGGMRPLDEPLPRGSTDDLEFRMRMRRQAELIAGG